MTTIELNGVTFHLTEATAEAVEAELRREREERRHQWFIWHWYARRWALYGDRDCGSMFSDLYKDEHGVRPHMTRDQVLWILSR